ncbi:MAG: Adaptor protein complex AP-2 alpha subunit [Piptocephalis tieghemiana]|nr:MAG: Adaptor protein complex AP-2 alpha subunit [Piptocephalis tieghemiana]
MPSMRGLTVFIADIRKCRVRELEERRINKELANIRAKFKQGGLDGYSRKKYVCKLLYCYILGWDVSFGHSETLHLIASSTFSEKQIGYLAATLFLTEEQDMAQLIINSVRKDLEDPSELVNCLALHAVANMGGRAMAESVASGVQKLLVSPTSKSFVRKKAALCLLRIVRKHEDVVPGEEWAPLILPLLADKDLGVVLATTSLVTALAQRYPEAYAPAVVLAIRRLNNLVVEREYTGDYLYYKVPIPWLQVKLLRILQYFPAPKEPESRGFLLASLTTLLDQGEEEEVSGAAKRRNWQHHNAQNAVLLEAMNLVISLGDEEDEDGALAARILGRFLLSKETNLRSLALDTMCHLTASGTMEAVAHVRSHQETVVLALRDRDVSVRRRALDLLYSMCTPGNARGIVAELLHYLPTAEPGLREEVIVRVAILAERYAGDRTWYVDTVVQLLGGLAGESVVGSEVWERLVQVVVGGEDRQGGVDLPAYAARVLLRTLQGSNQVIHESALKAAAYLLGEYGDLIASEPGCGPMDQFTSLHARFGQASGGTRAMLLTTYLKWSHLFPDLAEPLSRVFRLQAHSLDVELQQRACEYLALMNHPDLLATVCEEMPPFPQAKQSVLMNRVIGTLEDKIGGEEGGGEDRRTWVIGGREANEGRRPSKQLAIVEAPEGGMVRLAGSESKANDMALVLAQNQGKMEVRGDALVVREAVDIAGLGAFRMGKVMERHAWFLLKLMRVDHGTLYEDEYVQIRVTRSAYAGAKGSLDLVLENKSDELISGIVAQAQPHLGVTLSFTRERPGEDGAKVVGWQGRLSPGETTESRVMVECRHIFDEPPVLQLAYYHSCGGDKRVEVSDPGIKLPIGIWKFQEPVGPMGPEDFFSRWHRIPSGSAGEVQLTFGVSEDAASILPVGDVSRLTEGLGGFGLGILPGVDPREGNVVGIGVVHTMSDGKVGCLVRVEPSVARCMYRVTVRTTQAIVSKSLAKVLEGYLSSGC